jgi:colicin import membrane protein
VTNLQGAPSRPKLLNDRGDGADAALTKLQQTATLANANCDRATALVRTLSAELRDAQQRIADFEREAKGRLEEEAAFSQLQAEFDAQVDLAKRETEGRWNRRLAEAEALATRLQAELLQARQRATEAIARIERVNKDADERVVRAEAEADDRIERAAAEIEGAFTRLKREAGEARQRAEQAETEADRIRRDGGCNFFRATARRGEG